ncbi:MAG: MFS transporter [Ignavibacteriaceae bacterium]|nr:MFS transporter [Ignavibacteriaceae bacterium]NUM70576.1 MFS transporter [Ignavibacteriaceae bacterium]
MRKNLPLTLIFFVVFIDLLGFGILIPILPTFAVNELHVNEGAVGVAIAAYSFIQFIFNPIFGGLSDRYGRRKIILFTLLLNATGYVIFAYTHNFPMLLLSRVIAGMGGSSIGVAQAYIADVTTPQERSRGMGLIGVAFGLGFVFGPLIGGILSKFGYEVTGLAAAGFSVLALIVSFFSLPEPEKKKTDPQLRRKIFDPQSFKVVFRSRAISFTILSFFFLTFSMANIYGTFALLGHLVYNLSDFQNGLMFGLTGFVSAAIQGGFIGKLNKKLGDKKLVIYGLVFMTIGLAMLPFGVNIYGLIAVLIVLSIGTGIVQPTLLSLVSKVTKENEQGLVLGTNQSIASLARVLGPLWGGFSYQWLGYTIPFLTGSFVGVIMIIYSLKYFDKFINLNNHTHGH